MLQDKFESRWHAFAAHLLISLLLFIAMCLIIVVYWYPGVLFTTEGGWQGVKLIAGIDFIIGPILTLLVYKKGKKSLKFDLTVIATLQVVCITFGMYVVHHSRPAVIAYADGVFYTTPLLRFDSRGIDINESPYLQGKLPAWVNIRLPEDPIDRLNIKLDKLGRGIETSLDLYEPYKEAIPLLTKEGLSIKEAQVRNLIPEEQLSSIPEGTRIFRLITRYNHYAVALNTETGKFDSIITVIKPQLDQMIPADFLNP